MAFFAIFKKALTKEEIEEYIGKEASLNTEYLLHKDKYWAHRKWYHSPKGLVPLDVNKIFSDTEKNNKISEKYLKKAKSHISFMRFLPFVQGVAVVNSVAFKSADKKSDIDLFIIAKDKHIWTVRILSTFFLHILGIRRHGRYIKGRFCLSFFATESNLDLRKIKFHKDIFLAFWTASIIPLFGKKAFQRLANENREWVKKEAGVQIKFEKQNIEEISSFRFWEKIFGKRFEKLMRKMFLKRTQKKSEKLKDRSGTIISNRILKFHDKDKRVDIQSRFEELVMC